MQTTYGQYEIDTGKFPQVTIDALVRRGISHVLGNEASSKVNAWAEKEENAEATDEAKAAKKAEFQVAFLAAMESGELGAGATRGPRVDPVEAAANAIAKREVSDVLKGAGLKIPKGDSTVKFADGQEFTMAELIERRLTNHGERIMKEATKHVSDLERKAKKAREDAAKVGTVTSEALGL